MGAGGWVRCGVVVVVAGVLAAMAVEEGLGGGEGGDVALLGFWGEGDVVAVHSGDEAAVDGGGAGAAEGVVGGDGEGEGAAAVVDVDEELGGGVFDGVGLLDVGGAAVEGDGVAAEVEQEAGGAGVFAGHAEAG